MSWTFYVSKGAGWKKGTAKLQIVDSNPPFDPEWNMAPTSFKDAQVRQKHLGKKEQACSQKACGEETYPHTEGRIEDIISHIETVRNLNINPM